MSYGYVAVGSSAGLILGANPQRLSVILINGGGDRLHFAQDASLSTAAPFLMPNGAFTEDANPAGLYRGPFYGISTGGVAVCYYWERIR